MRRPASALVLLAVCAAACRDDRLRPGEGQVRLSPALLELPEMYRGETAAGTLEVQNAGTSALALTWTVEGEGLSLEEPPAQLPGGAALGVAVRVALPSVGEVSGTVRVQGPNNEASALVRARAVERPPCVPSQPCMASTWSEDGRTCVEAPLPDGAACGDVCLENPSCVQGRCVGDEKRCDDGDACTADLCMAGQGCTHRPAPPCPGDGLCQVGVCHPARGCELAPAPDGQGCGRTGCLLADVCIGGACVERDPPDGFICAEASPCQAEGRCQQDACVQPPPAPLSPAWGFGGPLPDGGQPPATYSDVLLSPTGEVTLSGYFTGEPLIDARAPSPVALTGVARRCIWWQGVLACADHPGNVGAGVSGIDAATGAPKWVYGDVLENLPQLVGANRHTFLARLVVLGATRLAAVFESRTVHPNGADTNCRSFSVVVLDRYGQKVSAWLINDPIFTPCNHPHSFGAASDAQGNLYLAFTPSVNTNPAAPAVADTLLISFTELGQLRWKGTVPSLPGGELAVANGLLFHQHLVTALSTADGVVAGVLPREFDHGVVTRSTVVPAPAVGASTLFGFSAPGLAPAWQFTLPLGAFSSDVARLATWSTRQGPRAVVLGFAASGPTELVAVDAANGRLAFSCPLASPVEALLFEVGDQGMAVMSAEAPPQSCSACDPRYAGTRNRFSWYGLPGIGRSREPWPGTLGGPGHDHHED